MIEIHGASDDLVCVAVDGKPFEEFSDFESSVELLVGTVSGGVIVEFSYGDRCVSVWRASIRQIDEGVEIPWPVTIENAPPSGYPDPRSYSVLVRIACPVGTPVAIFGGH